MLGHAGGDCIAQGVRARNAGIACVPCHGGGVHGLQNGRGGADVMLANRKFGNLVARLGQGAGTKKQPPAIAICAHNTRDSFGCLHQPPLAQPVRALRSLRANCHRYGALARGAVGGNVAFMTMVCTLIGICTTH